MKDQKSKHLTNMQHLLQQYDRQNRFLNDQILQLLRQNSRLQLRKLSSNIFSEQSPDIINHPRRICSKSISKSIAITQDIASAKHTIEQQAIAQGSNAAVNLIVKNQNEDKLKQTIVQNNHQQSKPQITRQIEIPTEVIADQSFSFRKTPVKSNQDINSDTKNTTSFSIISKVTQQTIYFGQGNSALKQQMSIEKLNKSCSQSSSFSRFRAISNQKPGRHELKPSPKIDDKSIPKDRINMSPLRKKQKNQRQKIMNRALQSGQKKRRFIEVVSNRFTPPKIIRQNIKDPSNCC